jgi:hypothetical protein
MPMAGAAPSAAAQQAGAIDALPAARFADAVRTLGNMLSLGPCAFFLGLR